MKCEHCQQEVFDGTQHAPFNSEHKVCLVSAKQAVQSDVVKASADVIHSRASWSSTDRLADSTWVCGKATSFMFMPSGQHTICAGFRDGSIELSVNVTPETAKRVQASLDAWRAERPRQQPFGCIEHREHEASVCVTASCGFEWKEDGVYLTAEPTSLGANNVNGKVHRSWSPSFTTDADYAKASDDNGTLRFPDGVRGSRSNPAEITGIDFCLGTLTNRPAFIEMKPVKGSESIQAAGTSEGARKGWLSRERGIVNDYGQVDVHRGIPSDFVHIPGKRLGMTAKAHDIEHAPALVGWKTGKWGGPEINGIVVHKDDEQIVRDAISGRNKNRLTYAQKEARRQRQQEKDASDFAESVRFRFPSMPENDVQKVSRHATEIGSGRVGRASGVDDPVHNAVVAHIRHQHTNYDSNFELGIEKSENRAEVSQKISQIYDSWLKPKEEAGKEISTASESNSEFETILARESSASNILAKVAARNKPPVVTIEQINERFGKTKTGDTRQTPDEILAKIYARSGASR